MKQTDSSYKTTTDTEWQLLGEFDLPGGSDANSAITFWLKELLTPLELSTEFIDRVMKSARNTVTRILQSNAETTIDHIHLSIFAPNARIPERKTWGFFHIERVENQGEAVDARNHAIDFYLYVEGQ